LPSTENVLERLDGTRVSPKALLGSNGTVFLFWSNECPWVERYENRVRALASDFQGRGIEVVLVNANDVEAQPNESREASRSRAREKRYEATYVRDPTANFARALGARRTPHAFLFDAAERLVYVGSIDDSPSGAGSENTPYLRHAIEAVLEGEEVPASQEKAFGCTLKYPEGGR
jgi:thiol-disulfide isomerase/thioredoxin